LLCFYFVLFHHNDFSQIYKDRKKKVSKGVRKKKEKICALEKKFTDTDPLHHQSPCAFIASATLINPATFAPDNKLGSTSSITASPDRLLPALKQI
jgi:hypothetical protein